MKPLSLTRSQLRHEITEDEFLTWFQVYNPSVHYFLRDTNTVTKKLCGNENHYSFVLKTTVKSDFAWHCLEKRTCNQASSSVLFTCENQSHHVYRVDDLYDCYELVTCTSNDQSLRNGTIFFHDDELTVEQTIKYLYAKMWYYRFKHILTYTHDLHNSPSPNIIRTLIDWNCFIREGLVEYYSTTGNRKIGGRGRTIILSDCIYGFRKYYDTDNRRKWVCAGIDVSSGEHFFKIYDSYLLDNLTDIIKQNIDRGTQIMFDGKSFRNRMTKYERERIFNSCGLSESVIKFYDYDHYLYKSAYYYFSRNVEDSIHIQKYCAVGYFAFFLHIRICVYKDLDPFYELFRVLGETYTDRQPPFKIVTDEYPTGEVNDV